MSNTLAYWYLKLQALVLLVFGRQPAALEKFTQMLLVRPGDRYALASRAHVLAQLGDKPGAIAAVNVPSEKSDIAVMKIERVLKRGRRKPVIGMTPAIVSMKPVVNHCAATAVMCRSSIR